MRLVEAQMLQLMDRRSNGKAGSNTHVRTTTEGSVDVYLHDNQIAHLDKDGKLFISDAGWQTNTTKSRLNAIINYFCDGTKTGVMQSDYEWYLYEAGCISYMNPSQWYEVSRKQYGKEVELPKFSRKALATARGAA
tara:strand:- start:304 stop:711 length:408 start_codon:yes stop_codon:yes gene_type:complete